MNEELRARLALFEAIEGGSKFWPNQISTYGAPEVCDRIACGAYDPIKHGKVIDRISLSNPERALEKIEEYGATFLTPETHPWEKFENLASQPIGLIAKGDPSILLEPSISIVGTRNPSAYGARVAGDFAAGFADRGYVITSGGAYGIDTLAHKGALIAEGTTIAVLACGIDVNYPAGNARLFHEIAETGVLLSEVMPGVPAIPARFLMRNRLIAAMSKATLVVEAAFRSGSLRTALDASELSRLVMAIPGPITSPTSDGCHKLIGSRAAELVTSVPDAMELLGALGETITP